MAKKAYIGIPKEYTLLEYIESTGTQYIDTGFKPNQDTRVVMDADITNSKTLSFQAIFSTDSSGSNKNRFVLMLYNEQSGFHDHYNGQTINSSNLNMYGRHVFEKNKNITYLDSAVVSEFTYSAFQSDITLTLFSTIDGGVRQYYSKVKMYSCQVYDNGVLIRDFVPCKHADGTIGLYDKVNDTFYANAGTGTFTAGNVVGTYNTESVAVEINKMYLGINGVAHNIKKGYIGVPNFEKRKLPEGYTQVEYIESDGNQYINADIVPNQDTRVVLDIELTETPSNIKGIFGARTDTTANVFGMWLNSGVYYPQYYNSAYNDKPISKATSGRVLIDMDGNTACVSGDSVTFSAATFDSGCPLYLLSVNTAGTADDRRLSCKIRSGLIYQNGTLVRDYVPCVNADGEAGLYDMIDGVFQGNAGTGAFAAGTSKIESFAQLFFDSFDITALKITYSGKYTDEVVTMGNGKKYRLLSLTSSGTLTLPEAVQADIWMCNGGAAGAAGQPNGGYSKGGAGGAGGNFCNISGTLATSHTITVGAASGASSITGFSPSWKTGSGGGSGATSFGHGSGGAKASSNTRPFADSYFTSYPCAGGGGGAARNSPDYKTYTGGNGGSSTGAGSTGSGSGAASSGGTTGGGKGQGNSAAGSAGSYYGSGGGGGNGTTSGTSGSGYSGYQGACFIRIPLDQSA